MATTNNPRRAVLRFHVRYERDEAAIVKQYLASTQSEQIKHFFIHSIPPNQSSKMHTVLDLHHVENPTVDLDAIPYEVLFVEKKTDFVFRKLEDNACKLAKARCRNLYWGTDRL
ncbi:hypothetical protein P171DRAFT_432915 [Karstenula rhodostoma CBS 690.94]|uniref:Uncharacterized protein n=1 Tax=Karstenula rhodostoma CBS 690.94 TaxID=1392251 RepID=A0A9P4PGR7_9PLEO|nr:hypothetical protein P171DRAFT_432915 [Karstenula rhodostoma CBS 690.94]